MIRIETDGSSALRGRAYSGPRTDAIDSEPILARSKMPQCSGSAPSPYSLDSEGGAAGPISEQFRIGQRTCQPPLAKLTVCQAGVSLLVAHPRGEFTIDLTKVHHSGARVDTIAGPWRVLAKRSQASPCGTTKFWRRSQTQAKSSSGLPPGFPSAAILWAVLCFTSGGQLRRTQSDWRSSLMT